MSIKNKSIIFAVLFTVIMALFGELFLYAFAVRASANTSTNSVNVDITTSSVRDDLASMDKDKLSYLSDKENLFIAMAQYYDKEGKLRTYIYFNYTGSTEEKLSISISVAVKDAENNITEKFKDYSLSFVNNEETWVKYEVLGLSNLNDVTRRYKLKNISSSNVILNIDEVYIFHGITNNSIEVFNQEVETIEITEKDVRFFCYGEENKFYEFWGFPGQLGHDKTYTDAWYVFFNTDKPIDNLKEVEITYHAYDYHAQKLGSISMDTAFTEDYLKELQKIEFDEKITITYAEKEIVTVSPGTSKISQTDDWWSGYQTKYREIDNIMDLRKYDKDKDGNPFVFAEQKEKYTWGVNFLNTEKKSNLKGVHVLGVPADSYVVDGTGIGNTAVLRLKYEINGIEKNAYCIDVPTDDFSGSSAHEDNSNEDWWEKLLALLSFIAIVLLLSPLAPIVSPILSTVFSLIIMVLKLVLNILTLPFRLLGRLLSGKDV